MLKLYNTLSREIEPFTPITPGIVHIYSCGPTVYRYIHIGNLRTFLMADWLRRALNYAGIAVKHVKNITDVGHMRVERIDQGEDKMLAQARKEGKTAYEIADFYTEAFLDDERRMNILPADVFPRATQHIAEMIEIVQGLERNRLAYAVDGNVFFDIHAFPNYGQLSGNQLAQLIEGARDTDDTARRNPEDFPLWKVAEPSREMAWDSPWGRGFPGWHIECSAMSMKYLGQHFDIHTGGVDNIFPHHEGELAQSEGYTGERFVNYWLHAQHLLADGLKMAKSTGNAYTLSDIEARGFEPMALRYLYANVHYRSRINFTFSALRAAETGLRRLRLALLRLAEEGDKETRRQGDKETERNAILDIQNSKLKTQNSDYWQQRFVVAIENDLNLPQAIATVWELLRGQGSKPTAAQQLALVLDWDRVLGLQLHEWLDQERTAGQQDATDHPNAALLHEREAHRAAGRYAEADARREQIRAAGYSIRDTRNGPVVVPRPVEQEFTVITRSLDVPDGRDAPDAHEFSVNLLAQNSRADLQRCIESIARHRHGRDLEIIVVDNGSTDDTERYLQELARNGLHDSDGDELPLTVLFADHNLGFAGGRNATLRASRGRIAVLLDTSIELCGDIWTPLAQALKMQTVGLVGPYGLVTDDLKEFAERDGFVDAIEGYLMAFPRALLREVGWFDEKFRFYRLADIFQSFMFKTAGYLVQTTPDVAARVEKHPHREWYSLSEEDRVTKSKKNYDIFRRRWHHGQSLQANNYDPAKHHFGHDHRHHLMPNHTHAPDELPPRGQSHTHTHRHWPDHDHEHPHQHDEVR